MLTFDESSRSGKTVACGCCDGMSERTWAFVNHEEHTYVLFFASCYDHDGSKESWIDVVFGSWGDPSEYGDHFTIGCRYGPTVDSQNGLTIVDAASVAPESPLFGRKLSRAEAMEHDAFGDFWQIIDFLLAEDPLLVRHHGHNTKP